MAEQPSPLTVLPSSHCSIVSTTVFPQTLMHWQELEQVFPPSVQSELTCSGASHCSLNSTIKLPQTASYEVQEAEQPSPLTVLPSSHSSPKSTKLLPQRGTKSLYSFVILKSDKDSA